ncbi:MAG: hypothetical protein HC906_06525 [Bacteroidales bacterium]|nr:hypothetical protein [Bacteroidales bacterium]
MIIEPSKSIRFQKNAFGYEPITTLEPGHWIAKNVPAIHEEPYLTSIENYITKFEFDIQDFYYNGSYIKIAATWNDVSKYLFESDYFGKVLQQSNYLNDEIKIIEEMKLLPQEKLKAAFELAKTIQWDQKESVFTTTLSLESIFKKKIGNSTEINLILLQILRKLDFEADPVVLSTRQNGILSITYPSLAKLNHTIVRVKLNDEFILIDATEKYLPYHLLPKKCLNYHGRAIYPFINSHFVDLIPTGNYLKKTNYNLNLENNLFSGKIINEYSDYAGQEFRNNYFHSIAKRNIVKILRIKKVALK